MLMLNADNVASYLRSRGVCDLDASVEAASLPGGVSNAVLAICCAGNEYVLKQALPRLQVEDEWVSDVERIEREVDCQEFLGWLLGSDVIPAVVFRDRENHTYMMRRAPRAQGNWKGLLLAGDASPEPARRAGEILGTVHAQTAGDPGCQQRFGGKRFFVQLRLDPYYGKLTAEYPSLQPTLQKLSQELLEGERCFVHGDYSPKNMLVRKNLLTLVDFEVGHYGNPVFDLGFFLTHLFLKTLKHRARFLAYQGLIRVFWNTYASILDRLNAQELERAFLPHLGAIMLARVDGKSKVDYLNEGEKEWVRRFTPPLIHGELSTLPDVLDNFAEKVGYLRCE